ncbi:MAG: hypothetical protein V3V06_05330 [Dehalococcoidia bacterium]
MTTASKPTIEKQTYEFGFHNEDEAFVTLPKGLSPEIVNLTEAVHTAEGVLAS